MLDIAEGESIVTILPVSRFDESHYVFLATVNGVMKKTSLKEFAVIRSVGKAAIALDDGDSILTAVITDGTQDIMVFGSNARCCALTKTKCVRWDVPRAACSR